MKNFKYLLFILMVIAQWYIPLKMLSNQQSVIAHGNEFHFLTKPVDPYDPFRGKFITLTFEEDQFEADYINQSFEGEAYAEIASDDQGFAKIIALSKQVFSHESYIKIHVKNVVGQKAFFTLPFNKYFLNENLAETAEKSVRFANSNLQLKCYAKVTVKNGDFALQDVMLEEQRISELSRNIKSGIFEKQTGLLKMESGLYLFQNCEDKSENQILDHNQILNNIFEQREDPSTTNPIYAVALIDLHNNQLVFLLESEELNTFNNCLE